jgi:hypothetical protein
VISPVATSCWRDVPAALAHGGEDMDMMASANGWACEARSGPTHVVCDSVLRSVEASSEQRVTKGSTPDACVWVQAHARGPNGAAPIRRAGARPAPEPQRRC